MVEVAVAEVELVDPSSAVVVDSTVDDSHESNEYKSVETT